MKEHRIFEQLARALLIMAIAGNLLAVPSQTVFARPASGLFTDCSSQSEIPIAECDALVVLYTNTDGAQWNDYTGWLQTNTPCSWVGVACNGGHVTSLVLDGNNLSGVLPAELASLTQLRTLELVKNVLSGSIPGELGSLANLTTLNLGGGHLSGPIPTQLASLANLTTLNLGGNELSGSIPSELGYLTNLTTLDLDYDQLSGSIPGELGNLTNLTTLDLSGNDLSGSIPTGLDSLANLTTLDLRSNALSGSIPTGLDSLTNLTDLNLDSNALNGSIPPALGSLSKLTRLDLGNNALSSAIPNELGSLTDLTTLRLYNNALSGPIPVALANLTNLTELSLAYNTLGGPIPPELGRLTNLTTLDLNKNALSGSIPAELGSLIQLDYLDLSRNALSGEFPTSITNLNHLRILVFDCELTSSNGDVIAFIDGRVPGWQDRTCPALVSPDEGALLDNGRLDRLDDIIWDFDWSDVQGATKYELYVDHAGAPIPVIDNSDLVSSSYHYVSKNSYIIESNRSGWEWKTRAYINGQWGAWSRIRTFSVEPPDSDAAQVLTKNGGFNAYAGKARVPTYWKAVGFIPTDGKTTTVKQEGTASVKITGAAGRIKTLSQILGASGPAGDLLIFSYWVKGSAIPAAGVCRAQVLFYSGTTLKGAKTLQCPRATSYAFKKMTLNITAPAAYNKVVITFTYNKPGGTIWFDAVSLIR